MSDYEDYQLKVSWKLYWEMLRDTSTALLDAKFFKGWWDDTVRFLQGCVVFLGRVLVTLTFPLSALLFTCLMAKLNRQNKKALEELMDHKKGGYFNQTQHRD